MKLSHIIILCVVTTVIGCGATSQEERTNEDHEPIHGGPLVGLNLKIRNGVYNPDLRPGAESSLHVESGAKFYLQELDIISVGDSPNGDLDPVISSGDFSGFDWTGSQAVGSRTELQADGFMYQKQTWYRDAAWMLEKSKLKIKVVDASGHKLDGAELSPGKDDKWKNADDFLERRFTARVVTENCESSESCAGPQVLRSAEGILHLRGNLRPSDGSFKIPNQAVALVLSWNGKTWTVPVVVDPPGPVGYGLQADMELTNLPASGFYMPGDYVEARVTYRDAGGHVLFPDHMLPSYGEVLYRSPSALGIRYLTFDDWPTLYWAHKHSHGASQTFMSGPIHEIGATGTAAITPASLGLYEIPVATESADGWSGLVQETPITPVMFGCLFNLFPGACEIKSPDTFGFHVPLDGDSGTWIIGVKMRREWKGEVAHASASLRFQVGGLTQTLPAPQSFEVLEECFSDGVSHCKDCHKPSERTAVHQVGHGFADPGNKGLIVECRACHSGSYYFESTASIEARLEEIHCQTRRLEPPF